MNQGFRWGWSAGAGGHEPLHTGFVDHGMLSAALPGAVFASPTALQVGDFARTSTTGAVTVALLFALRGRGLSEPRWSGRPGGGNLPDTHDVHQTRTR